MRHKPGGAYDLAGPETPERANALAAVLSAAHNRCAAIERELRRQLRALDPAPAARPARKPRPGITVRWSVRRPDGGLPFVFTYTAPAGTWLANAEHDTKTAIKRAGLIPWAHLGTQEPHA